MAGAASMTAMTAALVTACSATSAGQTCEEFLRMNTEGQTAAIVDWAKDHDDRIDPENPNKGFSGFALFQDRASLNLYCADPAHRDDQLGDLRSR